MFRYSIVTFGCRVNQADSFAGERQLARSGGVEATPDEADVVLVNTCSVTAAADQAARQAVRRIARRNPSARIVVTGCYATRRPGDLVSLPGVVRLLPNSAKDGVADAVLQALDPPEAGRLGCAANPPRQWILAAPVFAPGHGGRTAFPLRVQSGCDESCSYCTIPATRGSSRSCALDDVLREARSLVESGYKELVVTGVHLGAWGRDLHPACSLADLLAALDRLAGDVTFRLSSLEPMDCSPAIVAMVAASGRFAPHFHLPLQHASDRLLRAMRRPYRFDGYRELVDRVRSVVPDAAIGCDVMVGFPGETAGDHRLLEDYLPSSPVTHLHVFPYSPRPGTDAERMAGRPGAAVVSGRCSGLRQISRALASRFAAAQVGLVRPAITIEDGRRAVTDNYLKVAIPPGRRRNERVRVRIASASPLAGEVIA